MNKLDIYLENRKLDIDNVDLALTYSFSDLSNPTSVTGDYSKTITIKGNQTNNEIFGQIWSFDRTILDSETSNIGVNFNPSKRVDCKIYINGGIFKSGYVKLNSIKMLKGVISYDITFYSELCNVLHTLNDKKIVNLPFYLDLKHRIDRGAVNSFWLGTHPLATEMNYVMANNGLYDNFQNTKMLTWNGSTDDLPKIVNVADGIALDECAKGEYRSYKQKPALKIDNICNMIANDTSINLDKSFFNSANPYFNKTYIVLPQLNDSTTTNEYSGIVEETPYDTYQVAANGSSSTSPIVYIPYIVEEGSEIFSEDAVINMNNLTGSTSFEIEANIRMRVTFNDALPIGSIAYWYGIAQYPVFHISFHLVDLNGNQYNDFVPFSTYDSTIQLNRYTSDYGKGYVVIDENNGTTSSGYYYFLNPFSNFKNGEDLREFPIHFKTAEKVYLDKYQVVVDVDYDAPSQTNVLWGDDVYGSRGTTFKQVNLEIMPITKIPDIEGIKPNDYIPSFGINYTNGFVGKDIIIHNNVEIKSDTIIDKYQIIDNELTCGNILIEYAKMFGLIFDTDNDVINICNRNKYFRDYKILDWSNKIDFSKAITQTPITFEEKYIQFNYINGETHYETYYNNKYSNEYGVSKINTGYEFNNDISKLLDKSIFYNTVMSRERTNMIVNGNYVYVKDEKILPAFFKLEDNQRNLSETKYNLLFDNGLINLSNSIVISDDDPYMLDESLGIAGAGEPCWIDTTNTTSMDRNGINLTSYRQFSTLTSDGLNSLDFGYPRENYSGWNKTTYPESSTIYNNFWNSYISEIYNVDNKIVKCYVKLTPNDMCQFSFRNFIKAFGCLWHVNKINNYNPLSDKPTEVEMIKVTNIDAYVNGQKQFPVDYTVTRNLTNVYSSNLSDVVQSTEIYTTNLSLISPDDAGNELILSSVTITMDDVDITDRVFDRETQTITIEHVSGDIVITAIAKANNISEDDDIENMSY